MVQIEKPLCIKTADDEKFYAMSIETRVKFMKDNMKKGLVPFKMGRDTFEESFDFLFNEAIDMKQLNNIKYVKSQTSNYGFFKKDHYYNMLAKYLGKEVSFSLVSFKNKFEDFSDETKKFVVDMYNKIESKEVMNNMKAALTNLTKTPFSEFEVFFVEIYKYENYFYPYIAVKTKENSRYSTQYAIFFIKPDLTVRVC